MMVDIRLRQQIDACQYRRMSKSVVLDPGLALVESVACCSPIASQAISQADAECVAPLLKALADPVRLRLLSLVMAHDGSEACVCDLLPAFDLSQPTISHHLKVLHEAGLVDREKRGVWVFYRARPEAVGALSRLFAPVVGVVGGDA